MIYIDCDDTLYHCKDDGSWEFDSNILEIIRHNPVVIWSGGGKDYASMWLNRVENYLGYKLDACASAKVVTLPVVGDVCIDDQPISVVATLLHYSEVSQ